MVLLLGFNVASISTWSLGSDDKGATNNDKGATRDSGLSVGEGEGDSTLMAEKKKEKGELIEGGGEENGYLRKRERNTLYSYW